MTSKAEAWYLAHKLREEEIAKLRTQISSLLIGRDGPSFNFPIDNGIVTGAKVSQFVNLQFTGIGGDLSSYSADEALQFARWIIDTFEGAEL